MGRNTLPILHFFTMREENRFFIQFVLVSSLGCVFIANEAYSHSLDPESIDRHAEITLTSNRLVCIYELLLGINPTNRAVAQLDSDGDKNITDAERDAYVRKTAGEYAPNQAIQIGQTSFPLTFVQGDAYRTIGHNGINVLKIDLGYACEIPADIPRETTLAFTYRDGNLENRNGWKQIGFIAADGVRFSGHLPYRDFGKFDYNIIETKGFIPATDAIKLNVNLPQTSDSESNASITMPVKNEIDLVKAQSGLGLLMKLWGLLGAAAAACVISFVLIRWKQSNSLSQ